MWYESNMTEEELKKEITRLREYCKELLVSENAKHIVYAVFVDDQESEYFGKHILNTPLRFYTDNEFDEYVNNLNCACKNPMIYAVHA